jgi:hypothetical protein
MFIQANQAVLFDPSGEGSQHSRASDRSFQPRLKGVALSGLFSPHGHSVHQLKCCVPSARESTFLRSLRSTPVTEFHCYYGRSDSCSAGSLTAVRLNTSLSFSEQVSLINAQSLPDHSVSKHPTCHSRRFNTLPLSAAITRSRRFRLRHWLVGSPFTSGRIEFVILRTDRSPPAASHPASRTDAVAVGYRPESVYLKRTFTSLTLRALRRTSPAVHGWVAATKHPSPIHRASFLA